MSRTSPGPSNRGGSRRSRPVNRSGGREADRIKDARGGWASPAAAVSSFWRSGPLPAPLAGVAAGVWAALVGLVVTTLLTLVVWIFAAGESASNTAMRVGADIWLVGHATPFTVGDGTWSLMPWAWIILPSLVLWAAGRWVAHRAAVAHPRTLLTAAGCLAGAYAVVGLLAALFGSLSGGGPMPIKAFLHTGVIAFLVSGAAMAWRARMGRDLLSRARSIARPAVGALAMLIAGSAAVLALALISSHQSLGQTLVSVKPGLVGGAALFAAWLGYFPAAMMWALSYVTGAGVVVAGVAVTPGAPLAQPLDFFGLELLPTAATPAWLMGVLIPVAAGVVLTNLAGPRDTWRNWLLRRAVASAIVLIVLDLWWLISVGRLGSGRLEVIGPSPLVIVVLMLGILIGIGLDVGARLAYRWWRNRSVVDITDETPATDDEDEDVPA